MWLKLLKLLIFGSFVSWFTLNFGLAINFITNHYFYSMAILLFVGFWSLILTNRFFDKYQSIVAVPGTTTLPIIAKWEKTSIYITFKLAGPVLLIFYITSFDWLNSLNHGTIILNVVALIIGFYGLIAGTLVMCKVITYFLSSSKESYVKVNYSRNGNRNQRRTFSTSAICLAKKLPITSSPIHSTQTRH